MYPDSGGLVIFHFYVLIKTLRKTAKKASEPFWRLLSQISSGKHKARLFELLLKLFWVLPELFLPLRRLFSVLPELFSMLPELFSMLPRLFWAKKELLWCESMSLSSGAESRRLPKYFVVLIGNSSR